MSVESIVTVVFGAGQAFGVTVATLLSIVQVPLPARTKNRRGVVAMVAVSVLAVCPLRSDSTPLDSTSNHWNVVAAPEVVAVRLADELAATETDASSPTVKSLQKPENEMDEGRAIPVAVSIL